MLNNVFKYQKHQEEGYFSHSLSQTNRELEPDPYCPSS